MRERLRPMSARLAATRAKGFPRRSSVRLNRAGAAEDSWAASATGAVKRVTSARGR